MTPANFPEHGRTHAIKEVSKKLRSVKGGNGFETVGEVERFGLLDDDGNAAEHVDDSNFVLLIRTESNIVFQEWLDFPITWDLTEDLVVILEYFEIEPEQIHLLRDETEEFEVPVIYDDEYSLDYGEMKDQIMDRGA